MIDKRLLSILVCPVSKAPVEYDKEKDELICRASGLAYPVRDGIPVMLESEARQRGIDTILANISSHNEQSLAFHAGHGFTECGRFRRAGRKFEKDFDIVWMQKFL